MKPIGKSDFYSFVSPSLTITITPVISDLHGTCRYRRWDGWPARVWDSPSLSRNGQDCKLKGTWYQTHPQIHLLANPEEPSPAEWQPGGLSSLLLFWSLPSLLSSCQQGYCPNTAPTTKKKCATPPFITPIYQYWDLTVFLLDSSSSPSVNRNFLKLLTTFLAAQAHSVVTAIFNNFNMCHVPIVNCNTLQSETTFPSPLHQPLMSRSLAYTWTLISRTVKEIVTFILFVGLPLFYNGLGIVVRNVETLLREKKKSNITR